MPTPHRRASFSLRHWWRQGRGATVVEYLVALILAALVVLGVVKLFGGTIYEKYRQGDERISEMDRKKLEQEGALDDSTLLHASGSGEGGSGRRDNKSLTFQRDNSGLNRSGGRSNSLDRKESRDRSRRGGGGADGITLGAEGDEDERGVSGGADEVLDAKMRQEHYALRGEAPPEEFRLNPFVIILFILLALGLLYMVIRGNKDEG